MSWQGIECNKILVPKCLLESRSWQFQALHVVMRTDAAGILNSLSESWVDSKYSLGSSSFILTNDICLPSILKGRVMA